MTRDAMLEREPDLVPEKAREPARRWRNRYSSAELLRFRGIPWYPEIQSGPGDFWGASILPSRELAEHLAAKLLGFWCDYQPTAELRHLGAFPDPLP